MQCYPDEKAKGRAFELPESREIFVITGGMRCNSWPSLSNVDLGAGTVRDKREDDYEEG